MMQFWVWMDASGRRMRVAPIHDQHVIENRDGTNREIGMYSATERGWRAVRRIAIRYACRWRCPCRLVIGDVAPRSAAIVSARPGGLGGDG